MKTLETAIVIPLIMLLIAGVLMLTFKYVEHSDEQEVFYIEKNEYDSTDGAEIFRIVTLVIETGKEIIKEW